jgi:alpha-beta hydrolase superfamily lysophospholipase
MNQANPSLPSSRALGPDIQREDLSWTFSDGYQTQVVCLSTGQAPVNRGAVVMLHGIQSHPGWFFGSAQHLTRQGWRVYMPVRRGSGNCSGRRGDAPGSRRLLADMDETLDRIDSQNPGSSVCGVGISWGGKFLAAWALDEARACRLSRMTLVSPGLCPRVDVSVPVKLAVAASLLVGGRKQFTIPLSDPALFTEDKAFQRFIRDDPLRLHRATGRFLLASRMLDRKISSAGSGQLQVPMGLILSSNDRIIDPAATRQCLERLAAGKIRLCQSDWPHTPEFVEDPVDFYRSLSQSLT